MVHQPDGKAGDHEAPVLEDAAADAERRDGAKAVVNVLLRPLALQGGGDVACKELSLAVGVLSLPVGRGRRRR